MEPPKRSDRDYVRELGTVLRRRDPKALRTFLIEQARRFGDDDQVTQIAQQSDAEIEVLMHRMTLARADLASFHGESRAWLARRGPHTPSGGPGRKS